MIPSPVKKTWQKILLVDDLSENLNLLQKIITPLGVEVISVESGDAALEAIRHHQFSVIILDVVMPGMDGYTLGRKLKEEPKTQEIPLIFITATDRVGDELLEGYEIGAVDYIQKPFVPKVLSSKVKALLEIYRKIHELELQRLDLETRESEKIKELEITQKSLNESRQNALSMMEDAIQAKALAEETAERYHMLFQNLPSGFALHEMIYDEEGNAVDYRFLQINPSFEALTGLKADDLIGKTVKEVLPDTEPHWIDVYAQVVETGKPAFYEDHAKDLDKYFNVRAYRPEAGKFAVLFSDVTKSRKDAEQLKLTQFAVDNVKDAVYWVNWEGRITYVNQESCRELGYTETELLQLHLWDVDPNLTAEGWPSVVKKFRKHGNIVSEILHQRKDGSQFPVEVRANYLEFDGNVIVCGFAHNITERKRMQEAIEKQIIALTRPLEDAEDIRFEELFNLKDIQRIQDEFALATNVASIITYPNGTPITQPSNFTDLCKCVIRKNANGCANCIISDAEIGRVNPSGPIVQPCLSGGLWDAGASISVGGKHIASWLIGQVRDETQTEEHMLAYAQEIGADENIFMEAFRRVPSMSKERFHQISNVLFTFTKQLSTSAYQNLQQARFIADEKRRTQELRMLSTAIEQSPEVIVITNLDGVIEYANPAFERTTGYACAEAIGRKPSVLKSNQHSTKFYTEMWQTITSGNIWHGRIVNQRKDGSLYTEEAVISPVKSPDGTITNFVAVKRDISLELVQEEQLQKAQKMEAVGQLAGGIAHDFNNILQSIMGYSDLLTLSLNKSDVESRENVEGILESAQHAADLTRQLLAFSRKQHVRFSTVNLNEVIKKTLKFLNSVIGETIRVCTDLDPNIYLINADDGQLERALLNLALNARDAMVHGGVLTLRTENITLTDKDFYISPYAHAGNYVSLTISDTGTGIPPDVIGRIFEPFFSTKPVGSGSGLGLSASYGIIRKHDGWIDVSSKPDQGTVFRIYLPIQPNGSCSPEDLETASPRQLPAGKGQRILIVEDADPVRLLSETILKEAGYTVISTNSAENAEGLFEKENGDFDLLFTDIILPNKSGAHLAASLLEKKPELGVLFCSGYSGDRIEQIGASLKDIPFLEKPFNRSTLLQQVFEMFRTSSSGM